MRIITADCRDMLAAMEPNSVHSIVTDPPYGIEFTGKGWDHEVPGVEFWEAALRVARPGAHLVAFGGTRKWHRLACAIEDAGWEYRDTMLWLYGSGCPHGADISKELDKLREPEYLAAVLAFTTRVRAARIAAGKTNRDIDEHFGLVGMAGHWTTQASQPLVPTLEQWPRLRDFLGIVDPELDAEAIRLNGRKGQPGPNWDQRPVVATVEVSVNPGFSGDRYTTPRRKLYDITAPASEAAKAWEGWNTTLKPGWEPIILARKPLEGTIAQNVARWGCGGINVGACELEGDDDHDRYPANVMLDEEAAAILDAEVGERRSGGIQPHHVAAGTAQIGAFEMGERAGMSYPASTGSVSRFFYTGKASRAERDLGGAVKNTHVTVKPLALMRWLVTLVTPRGGKVVDMFCGSGSTAVACAQLGFDIDTCDLDPVNAETARRRVEVCGFEIDEVDQERVEVAPAVDTRQGSLF